MQQRNKGSKTNGGGSGIGLRELPAVNGGDANLNLSEDSSEDGEDTDKSMFDEKTVKGVKRKLVNEAGEEAKRSSVN